ncbi:nuclear transport factor 2 family protein [Sinomonas sp. RB5]
MPGTPADPPLPVPTLLPPPVAPPGPSGRRGVLSGTKQGRDAILAYFGELGARSQGSFQAAVKDIVGGESHTVGIQQSRAENNGKTMDLATAIVFVLRDGKVSEGREYFEDTAKADDFWS